MCRRPPNSPTVQGDCWVIVCDFQGILRTTVLCVWWWLRPSSSPPLGVAAALIAYRLQGVLPPAAWGLGTSRDPWQRHQAGRKTVTKACRRKRRWGAGGERSRQRLCLKLAPDSFRYLPPCSSLSFPPFLLFSLLCSAPSLPFELIFFSRLRKAPSSVAFLSFPLFLSFVSKPWRRLGAEGGSAPGGNFGGRNSQPPPTELIWKKAIVVFGPFNAAGRKTACRVRREKMPCQEETNFSPPSIEGAKAPNHLFQN